MDIGDAVHTAIKALKNTFEGEMTERNLEVAIIKDSDPTRSFKQCTQEEIRDLLREVEWSISKQICEEWKLRDPKRAILMSNTFNFSQFTLK